MENNNTPLEWTEESHKSLNEYLDAVEHVLLDQSVSRSERMLILGELESQIHSMVAVIANSGASVSLSIVTSVLETLDTPDSYRRAETTSDPSCKESSTEPAIDHVSLHNPSEDDAKASSSDASTAEEAAAETSRKEPAKFGIPWFTMPDVRSKAQAVRTITLSYLNRSRIDEFALVSCISSLMAFLMAFAGRRNERLTAFAVFLLIVGCAAGWYSVYRIKRSDGKLWGGKWAFAGAMVLPVLLLNAIAVLLVIETPLWILLLTTAVLYLNYRLILLAWNWIAFQRMTHRPEVVVIEPPIPLGKGESVPAM